MKHAFLLSLIILTAADTVCPAWVCDPPGDQWAANDCAMQHPKNQTQWDLNTKACTNNEWCPAATGPTLGGAVPCFTDPKPEPAAVAYPGEPCDELHVCIAPEGATVTCNKGTCATATSPCVNVQDCGLGKTCRAGACAKLADVGSACTLDTDCVINAGCDIASKGKAGSGICEAYYSLVANSAVQACSGTTTTPAPHALCTSGYCYETSTPGKFACTGLFTSSGEVPFRCFSAQSSCTSAKDAKSGLALELECQCGYDGYPYCPLFPGDAIYQNYTYVVQDFLSSPLLSNCITIRHGTQGSLFDLTDYFWCAQNLTTSETYDYLLATLYPQVVMASDCVLQILQPEYFNDIPPPTPPTPTPEDTARVVLLGAAIFTLI